MKKSVILLGACAAMLATAAPASAQDAVVVEESVVVTEEVPCHTHYYSTSRDNWFIQLGAGIQTPFFDYTRVNGKYEHPITAVYNVAFGKWMSPYLGWRLSFQGGAIHWNYVEYNKMKYVNGNFDLMWDMFNSFNVNTKRVFSIVPFVGLGGTYAWDRKGHPGNHTNADNTQRSHQWMLPVSAGLQLRFRLSSHVDFFAEARASFYGDNFDSQSSGKSVDVLIATVGGFTFNIGGSNFKSYNPCDYIGYINGLNGQVNDLRAEVAATAAALAAAEAQLPCPEIQQAPAEAATSVATPLMATVRFKINSAQIRPDEAVNVYNIAQWMKANPSQKVEIAGYADKDTGTAAYNKQLSERRAQAVKDALVKDYGISADRLTTVAEGSAVQPYPDHNNWNRIVIFESK